MGVYIARNRVTNWANGEPADTIPAGEDIERAMAPIRMFRHATKVVNVSEDLLNFFKSDWAVDLDLLPPLPVVSMHGHLSPI